jgi:glycosyltransferase involved in cell wall biosynthesis
VREGANDLLVAIPARNEEARIPAVIARVLQAAPSATVVVIEDSSTDATARVAREAGARVLSLPANIGYGGAVQTGFRYAVRHGFRRVVTMDGDGQHNPADIPRLLETLDEREADLVIASRFVEDTGYRASLLRRVTMKFFSVLTSALSGQRICDTTSGFQALSARAVAYLARQYPLDYPNAEVLVDLARGGGRIVEVPVHMGEREGGTSMFDWWSSLYYVVKMTLSVGMVLVRRRRRSACL